MKRYKLQYTDHAGTVPVIEVADTVGNDRTVGTRSEVGRDRVEITEKSVVAGSID